jgi:hypothetical protein
MLKKLLLPTLLLAVTTVCAQQPTNTAAAPAQTTNQLTAEQQAQVAKQNEGMVQAALRVTQLIDKNKIGEVWDGASDVAKKIVSRDAFVRQISADRKTLGAMQSRTVKAVSRTESTGGSAPAGLYVNVTFATQFGSAREAVRELVSFHFDADRTWRISGYTVR